MAPTLTWSKLTTIGDQPTKRSGHSFSVMGLSAYMFGGCDKQEPAGPNNELFQLKMSGVLEWKKIDQDLIYDCESGNPPLPRWLHSACVYDTYVVVFGGFHSSTHRLGDLWYFDTITMTWSNPLNDETSFSSHGSHTKSESEFAPTPRGDHSASILGDHMWIFGGYGGQGYSRKDFNDIFVFDMENRQWIKPPDIKGAPPKPRSGHSATVVEDTIIMYGGWSASEQFADICILDTDNLTWSTIESYSEPRWRHTVFGVEAIPYFKLFCFGGFTGNLSNTNRAQGTLTDSVTILDSGTRLFEQPEIIGEIPCVRSDTTFAYDMKRTRLICFGGWSNLFLSDIYSLDVGNVVGPPYAIVEIHPAQGPITGGTQLKISGIDFVQDVEDPRIKIRFAMKRGGVADVPGYYINQTTISCEAPDFSDLSFAPTAQVDVRVAFKDDSFTTSSQKYVFTAVTDCKKSLAYGPGVLSGGYPGVPISFAISSRAADGSRRQVGGDEFTVSIRSEEIGVSSVQIEDIGDGTYFVDYTAPAPGAFTVQVEYTGNFTDEDGQKYFTGSLAGPIRGSPFIVEYEDGGSKSGNKMNGSLLRDETERKYQYVRKLVTASKTLFQKAVDPEYQTDLERDVKALLAIKEKLFHIQTERDAIELDMDVIQAVAEHLNLHHGVKAEKKLTDMEKLLSDWKTVSMKLMKNAQDAIKPYMLTHGVNLKQQIREFEQVTLVYENKFKDSSPFAFHYWRTGPEGALNAIIEAVESYELQQKDADEVKQLSVLFEFPEECKVIEKTMNRVFTHVTQMQHLWEIASDSLIFMDECKATKWKRLDPEVIEEESKLKLQTVQSLPEAIQWTNAFKGLTEDISNFTAACPIITRLRGEYMRERHWEAMRNIVGVKEFISPPKNKTLRLSQVFDLNLYIFQKELGEMIDSAIIESKMEQSLERIEKTWLTCAFGESSIPGYEKDPETKRLKLADKDKESLEVDLISINSMENSKLAHTFNSPYKDQQGISRKGIHYWSKSLNLVSQVTSVLERVLSLWTYLEPLFLQSEQVRKALPDNFRRFSAVNEDVRGILKEAITTKFVLMVSNQPSVVETLGDVIEELESCKRNLSSFLLQKKEAYPRFYFLSDDDLLDVLSHGCSLEMLNKHLRKLFVTIDAVSIVENRTVSWKSKVGSEVCKLAEEVSILDKEVEVYFGEIHEAIRESVRSNIASSIKRFMTQQRSAWLLHKDDSNSNTDIGQTSLFVSAMYFTKDTESIFEALQAGNRMAMRDYGTKLNLQLTELVNLLPKVCHSAEDLVRTSNLITFDGHARDQINLLMDKVVKNKDDFYWRTQMKVYLDNKIQLCDFIQEYGFEYCGNDARLVITPATERAFVSISQSLQTMSASGLIGHNGTSSILSEFAFRFGRNCFVFNCGPDFNHQFMVETFKGLNACGCWGCFDSMEHLQTNVVSGIASCIKELCQLMNGTQSTKPALFFTLSDHAAIHRLPSNISSMIRPISIDLPDTRCICEVRLLALGFESCLGSLLERFFVCFRNQTAKNYGFQTINVVLQTAFECKYVSPNQLNRSDKDIIAMSLLRVIRSSLQGNQVSIFDSLLSQLFGPQSGLETKWTVAQAISEACTSRELWQDAVFLQHCMSLYETLSNHPSVFLLGDSGSGKTECWRTLLRANQILGQKTLVRDMNPKVWESSIFGHISPTGWKDGLFTKSIRDLEQNKEAEKWLVIDGPVDCSWIDMLNTLLDSNATLTLASHEILCTSAKLIFETSGLSNASPSSVARGGMIYIPTEGDWQWRAMIASWLQKKEWDDHIKETLSLLFIKYLDPSMVYLRDHCRDIGFSEMIRCLSTVCNLLDAFIGPSDLVVKPTTASGAMKMLEPSFVICTVWGLGGALDDIMGMDYRVVFSDWWKSTFTGFKFPNRETIFDYFLDTSSSESGVLQPWKGSSMQVNSVVMGKLMALSSEQLSVSFWTTMLMRIKKPVAVVGRSGCGKTSLVKQLMTQFQQDFQICNIRFNYASNAKSFMNQLDASLEKRSGSNYGPPSQGKLIYFVDDLNAPEADAFGTQTSAQVMRQLFDYSHIHDQETMIVKSVIDTQLIACLNPSKNIDPRLLRHFGAFLLRQPQASSLCGIFQRMIDHHIVTATPDIKGMAGYITEAAIGLHLNVAKKFRKSCLNQHYDFNLNHVVNVFNGILMSHPTSLRSPEMFIKLWLHESERVYADRLRTVEELREYMSIAASQVKKRFPTQDLSKVFGLEDPEILIFSTLSEVRPSQLMSYHQIESFDSLFNNLSGVLDGSECMHLVLFRQAVRHVCRALRAIQCGHLLIISQSADGRSSIMKLACFLGKFQTFEAVFTSDYSTNEFKNDLKLLCSKAVSHDEQFVVIINETLMKNESAMMMVHNEILSGEIQKFFSHDDLGKLLVTLETKFTGRGEEFEAEKSMEYLNEILCRNLHCVFCCPTTNEGPLFQRFPLLVNRTTINWIKPWDEGSLIEIADKYLKDVQYETDEIREGTLAYAPFAFQTSRRFAEEPMNRAKIQFGLKSYFEFLGYYRKNLVLKKESNRCNYNRFYTALNKLKDTEKMITVLEATLSSKLEKASTVAISTAACQERVTRETEVITEETELANQEIQRCQALESKVEKVRADVRKYMNAAEPFKKNALDSLETLSKKDIGEAKSASAPPKGVEDVYVAVMVLLAQIEPKIQLNKNGKVKNLNWNGARKEMLNNINGFMTCLRQFMDQCDDFTVPSQNWINVRPLLELEHFKLDVLERKSKAGGALAGWVISIVKYHDEIIEIESKRGALIEGEQRLTAACKIRDTAIKRVEELEIRMEKLKEELESALEAKRVTEEDAKTSTLQLKLAQRLFAALGSEINRWETSANDLQNSYDTINGDLLVASGFRSYCGGFSANARSRLLNDEWIPYLMKAAAGEEIQVSKNPIGHMMIDEPILMHWQVCGLHSSSAENAALVTLSPRWPLILDPHQLTRDWILRMHSKQNIIACSCQDESIKETILVAIRSGGVILLEHFSNEYADSLLPVINFRSGKECIRYGNEDISIHPGFRIVIHATVENLVLPMNLQHICYIVNFAIAEEELRNKLLLLAAHVEHPQLINSLVQLHNCDLLFRLELETIQSCILDILVNEKGDICQNIQLIERSEKVQRNFSNVSTKHALAAKAQGKIQLLVDSYSSVAIHGMLLHSSVMDLHRLHSSYTYSLNVFVSIFLHGLYLINDSSKSPPRFSWDQSLISELLPCSQEIPDDLGVYVAHVKELLDKASSDVNALCKVMIKSLTDNVLRYVRYSIKEQDSVTFSTYVGFNLLMENKTVPANEIATLIHGVSPKNPGPMGPLSSWLTPSQWETVKGLETLPEFETLGDDVMCDSDEWRGWFETEVPENEKMPGGYHKLNEFRKLLVYKALRPDRVYGRLCAFLEATMGRKFIEPPTLEYEQIFHQSSPSTPILFIVSPEFDPTDDLDALAHTLEVSKGNICRMSMGQDHLTLFEEKMEQTMKNGGWLIVQNIDQIMNTCLTRIANRFSEKVANSHEDFRLFLTVASTSTIPDALLKNSLKVSLQFRNSLRPNLIGLWAQFTPEYMKKSSFKSEEFMQHLASLAYLHSALVGRAKYGAIGWTAPYSFPLEDLLRGALAIESRVDSLQEIRYLLAQCIYGARIKDVWDARISDTIVEELMQIDVKTQRTIVPGFTTARIGSSHKDFKLHFEKDLPQENPALYFMHISSGIEFEIDSQQKTLEGVATLSGFVLHNEVEAGTSRSIVCETIEQLPHILQVNLEASLEVEKEYPIYLALKQECLQMNSKLESVRSSLEDLERGLSGFVEMNASMERLESLIRNKVVPCEWRSSDCAALSSWLADIRARCEQLQKWSCDLVLPSSIWLGGLHNPCSFLDAVCLKSSRALKIPANEVVLDVSVSSYWNVDDLPAKELQGYFVHGVYIHGAKWGSEDEEPVLVDEHVQCQGHLVPSNLKDRCLSMPLLYIRGVKMQDTWTNTTFGIIKDGRDDYHCPVYTTTYKSSFVFSAPLKSKEPNSKWILFGVTLSLRPDEI